MAGHGRSGPVLPLYFAAVLQRSDQRFSNPCCCHRRLADMSSPERDELMRLAQEIPDDQVPDAVRELRRHLQPVSNRPWPPAFFASAPGDGVSIAEQADELLREGFGR